MGVGRPRDAARARRGGAGGAARADRRADPEAARRRARRVLAAARRAAAARRCSTRSATEAVFDSLEDRRAPRDRMRLRRPRPAAARRARRRARRGPPARAPPSSCAACSRSARRRASPSSPSAAAPAWSAGWRPSAARTAASSASTSPASRDVEVDRRSLTARLGAGLRGPEAEAALNREGARPRPPAAVVRVRDDRRLRRHPLRRPGLERLRALRRPRQLGAPGRPGR